MKKITILSMFVIVFVGFSFAQTATTQRQMRKVNKDAKVMNENTASTVTTPKFTNEVKSTLVDYILFEDFEDGANVFPPTGWETQSHDESTELEEWHFATHFYDGTNNPPSPETERNIASVRYQTATHQIDEWLITPELAIPATGIIDLEFDWQSHYTWFVDPNDNGDIMVKVSTDGGSVWSAPLWQEDDQALVEASGVEFPWSNYEWVRSRIDISAYVGQNIKVAFQVTGLDAASFEIDDITIKARNANDINLTVPQANFFYTNGGAYSKMPLDLVMAGLYGADIKNIGTEDQTNITLNVNISNGTESIYDVTATKTLNLLYDQNDTINIDSENDDIFVADAIGMYEATLTISSDATDDDLTNNTATAFVEVTEAEFARHFNVNYSVGPRNYATTVGEYEGGFFGSNFHFIADDTLKSIKVYVSESSKLNTNDGTLIGYVFDENDNVIFETETKDVSAAEVGTWVELLFDEGAYEDQILAGDSDYGIGVEIYENGDTLYIGADNTTPYQNLGISTTIRLGSEFFSTDIQPGIEVVLYREGTGIKENEIENQLKVYPNPTTGLINIENAENSTITILNLLGDVVMVVENTDANAVINISELSEGTYIVKLKNENGIATSKMNLVK